MNTSRFHCATLIRKIASTIVDRPVLSDATRNFVYAWAKKTIALRNGNGLLLDVGSRDTLLPAYLAWQGFSVTAMDPAGHYGPIQQRIAARWGTTIVTQTRTAESLTEHDAYDVVTAIFTLQHAGNNDIAGLRALCGALKHNGTIVLANECTSGPTRIHEQRIDGAMRIYGTTDVQVRILDVVADERLVIDSMCYVARKNKRLFFVDSIDDAAIVLLAASKK